MSHQLTITSPRNVQHVSADSLPVCDVCNKPVEELEILRDAARRETIYIARCHGDSQETRLQDSLVVDAKSIKLGRAFLKPTELPQMTLPEGEAP